LNGPKRKKEVEFELVEETENSKKVKIYSVNLLIDKKVVASGTDFSIKKAEQNAAAKAWESIEEESNTDPTQDLPSSL
jgi:dsRNA-specific ribonuclease